MSNNCVFQGRYIQTVYFRTTFNFSVATNNVILTLSNVMDDGVVVYLNGAEIIRSNIAAGAVSWTTTAVNAGEAGDAGFFWGYIFAPTNLHQGANVLAVELHNAGNNSSDMVFGHRLLYSVAQGPTITNQPVASTNVEIGTVVTLTVGVSGTPPLSYQWRRNGVNITSATNQNYTFTAHPTNAGTYSVVVTNLYGTATSQGAVVTVFVNSLVITDQPDSLTNEVGQTATFRVGVTGSLPTYQWQREGVSGTYTNIPGATSSNYTIGTPQTNHTGNYRVVVSNYNGSVTSLVAKLTVILDQVGPHILAAVAQDRLTTNALWEIIVRFSERVYIPTGTATSNYVVTQAGTTNSLTVSNAQVNGAEVKLRVSPWLEGSNYVLTVNNVRDNAFNRTNVIAPNSQVGVQFGDTTLIFPFNKQWDFSDYGDNLGTNWLDPNFCPTCAPYFWGTGNGLFWKDLDFPTNVCDGVPTTTMALGPITYYFLTRFVISNVAANAQFTLRGVVDDGAVFYLNGREVGRFNMPPGVISSTTPASTQVGNAQCATNIFGVTNLVSGTNIVGVEVHQGGVPNVNDADAVFGAELTATVFTTYTLPQPAAPRLNLSRSGNNVTLSWTGNGFALEVASDPAGPYVEVQPDMANPYTASVSGASRRFWRLKDKQP